LQDIETTNQKLTVDLNNEKELNGKSSNEYQDLIKNLQSQVKCSEEKKQELDQQILKINEKADIDNK